MPPHPTPATQPSSETPAGSAHADETRLPGPEQPAERPVRARRRVRRALACVVTIAGVLLTTAGTGHADPYSAPGPVPSLAPSTLDARYAAERRSIEDALETAHKVGDRQRAKALGAFLDPGRRFLHFDARGRGQAIEVIGDLARARRVALLVPGADTTLVDFDRRADKPWSTPGGGIRAVYDQARKTAPGTEIAVVAWLGYVSPRTFSGDVLTDERARQGAAELRRFLVGLRRVNHDAKIGLLCHSYGSVVCGRAALEGRGPGGAAWRAVSDIALFGSPGTTAGTAGELSRTARVWAGRGGGDWMEDVPHVRIFGLGLGPDPVSRRFGARVFGTGSGGHSDYLAPGSASLRNLTAIALGRPGTVTGN